MDHEVAPVLLVFPAPHELWVEVGVARILQHARGGIVGLHHGLMLGGGNVLPLGLVVCERFDRLGRFASLGHAYLVSAASCPVAVAIILLNSPSTLALKSVSIW